jgi:hypothetical protein
MSKTKEKNIGNKAFSPHFLEINKKISNMS